MTNKDLIKAIAVDSGLTQVDTAKALASLTKVVRENAVRGEDSPIPNLGVFCAKHKKARVGTNPRNGEKINIAAKTVLAFRVSSLARDL